MITYLRNMVRALLDSRKKAKKNLKPNYSNDTTKRLEGYYRAIDELPLYNWNKCLAGELKFIRRAQNGSDELDVEAWELVYDEYLKEFGLSKVHEKILKCIKDKAIQELDYVITGDRFKLTLIEMEENRLKNILSTAGTGVSVDQTLIHLSKWLGQWIKPKEITVLEFFNLQKEYERYIKMQNGKENK